MFTTLTNLIANFRQNITHVEEKEYQIAKKDIDKIVEIQNADSDKDTICYSGKIIGVVLYKKRVCTIVDTSGYINVDKAIGNILLLFNRYKEESNGNRTVNVLVLHSNVQLKDDFTNLEEYTELKKIADFMLIGTLKYKE